MPEDAQSAQANQDVGVWSTESFIAGLCKEVSGPPIALNSLKGFSKTFFFIGFLGLHLRHMEVPRLGMEWELPSPIYTTAHGIAGSLTP